MFNEWSSIMLGQNAWRRKTDELNWSKGERRFFENKKEYLRKKSSIVKQQKTNGFSEEVVGFFIVVQWVYFLRRTLAMSSPQVNFQVTGIRMLKIVGGWPFALDRSYSSSSVFARFLRLLQHFGLQCWLEDSDCARGLDVWLAVHLHGPIIFGCDFDLTNGRKWNCSKMMDVSILTDPPCAILVPAANLDWIKPSLDTSVMPTTCLDDCQ